MRTPIFISVVVTAIIASLISKSRKDTSDSPPQILGHNNTVLFVADSASGLSNIHIAASYGLQEYAPYVDVHYASFAKRQKDVSRVSSMGTRKFPSAKPISWHELPGPDLLSAVYQHIGNISGMIFPPGLRGIERLIAGMGFHLDPFEKEHYVQLYRRIHDLIIEIDPAVIVLDSSLRPALDAAVDLNRRLVMLSPNALIDTIGPRQPWGQALWKYPA